MPAPDAFCGEGVQKGVRRAGRAFRGAEGEQVKNGSERRVIAHGEALQRAFTVPRREQQGVGHGLHIRADVPEKMPRPRREGPRTDILFHQFGMIRFPALPRNENVPAGAPELGRSALDAVELMNIGVQFLREHMTDDARIHYAILDAGGRSPNVVQPRASVLYMVRSNHVAEAVELQARVDKIAQGAALMTETTVEKKFIDGLADTVTNHALERVLYQNFQELGVPTHTAEELAFADSLAGTYSGSDRAPGVGSQYDLDYAADAQARRAQAGHAMNRFLLPLYQGDAFQPGSTDVGDVSWQCPTAQIHVATWPNGCPGHSWQTVSCGRTDIGHKAALHAGKVLAAAAMDLFTQPALLEEAKAEFQRRTVAGYTCPIPANAVPVVAD